MVKLTDKEQFLLSITVATRAHAGQKRKDGTDYISHPMRVTARAMAEGQSILTLAICMLHDVIEDTSVTLEQLRELGFSPYVIDGVDSVTKRPGESYKDFILRAANNPFGKPVKIYDIQDNLEDQSALDPDEASFLRERYTQALAVLNED